MKNNYSIQLTNMDTGEMEETIIAAHSFSEAVIEANKMRHTLAAQQIECRWKIVEIIENDMD